MRRGAQWAIDVGVALIAMAAVGGTRADVLAINLDGCHESCVPVAMGGQAVAEADAAAGITLSRFSDADGPDSALVFDKKAVPAALADGLPSALTSASAEDPVARGVSPYDFFADVIDVPHSADAWAFMAVPFLHSAPSLTSRLSDFLWASNDFFGPPSGDIATRRAFPVSIDADALTGGRRTQVAPTPSPSPLSEPPSSDATDPFGQVGDKAGQSAEFSSDSAESNK